MITVGSRYFFGEIEGFESKDKDVLIIEDNPVLYNFYMQRKENGVDVFRWNRATIMDYDYSKNPMAVGKFLIPEVLEALNLTFNDVKSLIESHISNLDKRHVYQKVIFEFYKENESMTLTEVQRKVAFQSYVNGKK